MNGDKIMSILLKATQDVISLSTLMIGNTKVSTEDVITAGKAHHGVTPTAVDVVDITDRNGATKVVPVMTFSELPGKFYMGGTVLMKIVESWLEVAGSIDSLNDMLPDPDIHLAFSEGKTTRGQTIIKVELVQR